MGLSVLVLWVLLLALGTNPASWKVQDEVAPASLMALGGHDLSSVSMTETKKI